jgi:DNA-binding NtrC family response regulator
VDGVDAVQRRVHAIRPTTCVTGLIEDTNEIDPILANRRILIADDEDVIRETIAAVLARAGAITVMASDGDQATAMVRSQHFDLVISDINMPCQNGYAVFAAARRANPNCAVMLITGFGYDPEHSIVRASREGLSGVLFKPFKVERLMEEVHKALAPAPRA